MAYPDALFAPGARFAGYVAGAVLTGAGSAIEFVLWGELLAILGMRQTVVYGVAATIVGGLFYMVSIFFAPSVVQFAVALFPLLEMGLFWFQRDVVLRYRAGTSQLAREEPGSVGKPARVKYRKDLIGLIVISIDVYKRQAQHDDGTDQRIRMPGDSLAHTSLFLKQVPV